MKAIKFLTLTLLALVGMTSCSNDGDYKRTTENTYAGYVYASFAYVSDYYSGSGKLIVSMKNEVYSIKFSNEQWGEATFEKVAVGDKLEGTGTITVPARHGGEPTTYEATLSGTLIQPVITVPKLMQGGTTITFYLGAFPAEKVANTFSGTNTVTVGGQWTYTADIDCEITANKDGSINLSLPEYTLDDTMMGDLTLGAYTIPYIPYITEKEAFYKIYGRDKLTEHIKAEKDGSVNMDNDYTFTDDSEITIEVTSTGIKVTNSFSFGKMNLTIVTTFEGKVPSEK